MDGSEDDMILEDDVDNVVKEDECDQDWYDDQLTAQQLNELFSNSDDEDFMDLKFPL